MTQPPGYGPAGPGYPPGYWPPPPPASPAGAPLADFGQRFLAYLIDSAVLTVVAMIFAIPAFLIVIGHLIASTAGPTGNELDPAAFVGDFFLPLLLLQLGLLVFVLALYYVYAVEMMHRSGQTLGKKAMKIRIIPIDPARSLTRGMAAKRYLIQHVAGTLIPFFAYLDGLWQLWDKPYLQTLHDKVAQTIVVKVSS